MQDVVDALAKATTFGAYDNVQLHVSLGKSTTRLYQSWDSWRARHMVTTRTRDTHPSFSAATKLRVPILIQLPLILARRKLVSKELVPCLLEFQTRRWLYQIRAGVHRKSDLRVAAARAQVMNTSQRQGPCNC